MSKKRYNPIAFWSEASREMYRKVIRLSPEEFNDLFNGNIEILYK